MNKKGFTLVEIIVSISLVSVVMIFLFQIITTIKNIYDKQNNKNDIKITVAVITREVERDLSSFGLVGVPTKTCDMANNNIIPSTATNVKCIKLIYDGNNVKNNEGYIVYYQNNGKYFLGYKRGKENIIETQTVREINVAPKEDVIISTVNSEDNGLSSLKMVVPISKDNKKYDLVINFVDSKGDPTPDNTRKVVINTSGGELLIKEGEGTYEPGDIVTIKFSYDTNEYILNNVTCSDSICDNHSEEFSFTMPDKNVDITISLIKRNIVNYLNYIHTSQDTSGLDIDDTADYNLRYMGANPKNYILFNNETWRIIGVFNNITTIDEQEHEKTESLVKIVRNDSLGNYSWDSSESTTNSGYGINEWSQADLMYELNCDGKSTKYCRDDITEGYLSNLTTGSTTWYNRSNNAKNGTYEYRKNIKPSSIDKVAKVRWNTGRTTYNASALNSYNQERSTTLISTPSDNVPRKNTWDGKIALMYPSDYGYASTDKACRDSMSSETNNVYNCKNENWLFNGAYQWTLSPYSGGAYTVFHVSSGGGVIGYYAYGAVGVRPVLFLKSDVVITGGTGDEKNPYTID